jgi:type I restriction enzyme S subunit
MSETDTITIAELAEVNPKVDLLRLSKNTPVSFIPMSDLTESGRWVNRQERYLDDVRFGYTSFAENDVLFAKITPCMENGKGAHAIGLKNGVGFGSTEFHILRARGETSARYLFHWLQARTTRTRAIAYMGGSAGQQRVQSDFFTNFRVHKLGADEQSRIAAALDTLDDAIAKTEAVIAKLRQVRAGMLHDLLTRGLDPHGHLRDPIAHPEQFQDSPLGRIPNTWVVQTLEQITEPQSPICYGMVQVFDFVSDGVLVLAIRDILGDYATGLHRTAPNIDANYTRSRVRPGDVLISIKGTIGRIGLVPQHYVGNISRDLARVRPVECVSSEFLIHLLRSPLGQKTLERAQVGTTRAELSIAPLKRIAFAFPEKKEQERIAKILDEQDGLIVVHETELAKLVQLKSGLMTDLLTGRVRVPTAD